MKNLLLMRHAKSDWSDTSLPDFERVLNNRGEKAAPFMGNELLKREKCPELIISSPASRAKLTAEKVAIACNYKQEIQFEKDFYFGYMDDIINAVRAANNRFERIMIVGHNPTFESLVERLLKNNVALRMPTAAIASILFEINDWKDLELKSGNLEWQILPKELMS